MPEPKKIKSTDTPECFMSHLGPWAIDARWFESAVNLVKSGMAKESAVRALDSSGDFSREGNVAVLSIDGPMRKGTSKFAGTSTVEIRSQLRAAVKDSDITSILLHIDSPGGQVHGTKELADDIAQANSVKPVIAQIEDMGASAAFWIASQASQIFANETGFVGSIGAFAVLVDNSELHERAGVKVHVVGTGNMKGAGTEGTPITKEILADVQETVDSLNEFFLAAVMSGREMSRKEVEKLATGQTFIADKALGFGLIDGIQSIETTLNDLIQPQAKGPTRTQSLTDRFNTAKAQSRMDQLQKISI